jgi:glycosyltransferase involved in cell wall biosynthesis
LALFQVKKCGPDLDTDVLVEHQTTLIAKDNRIRVLLVTSSLHHGGAETMIASLFRSLDRNLFDVTLCLLKFRGAVGEELIREGHTLVEFPRVDTPVIRYFTFRRLRSFVLENGFDIVHSHCTYSFIDSAICKIVGARFSLIHTFHFGNYPHYKVRYKMLEGVCARVAHTLVMVGQRQSDTIKKMYALDGRRLTTIWNGVVDIVDRNGSDLRARWLQQSRQLLIGSIGNLIPQKGYSELLEVADILKQSGHRAKFVVVGGGPLESDLKRECLARGLDDVVEFAGYVDRASLCALPAFDIFFMPSRWEAMSVALLEAMAAKKAIVATAVGDNAVVIRDRVSGIIVPPGNPVAMAGALSELIDDQALRVRLADAARIRFEEKFELGCMVRSYENLYRTVRGGSERSQVSPS